MKKSAIYSRIKIYGFLSYIPIVLAVAPLSGWALGSYLEKKFVLPAWVSPVFAGFGFVAAIIEIIRIIKLVSRIEKDK